MTVQTVFYDVCDTRAEAARLTARADLMIAINKRIKALRWTRRNLVTRLGLTLPRADELLAADLERFTVDELVSIAAGVGVVLHVETG